MFTKAVEKLPEPLRLPGLGEYTEGQLFWLAYAGIWCGEQPEESLTKVATGMDNHSPWKYRLLGTVTQLSQFSKDWGCPVNSPMNPADKCDLW